MDWVWKGRDQEKMIASRSELVRLAEEKDATLIPAHFPFPGMGKLKRDGDTFNWAE